MMDSVLELNAHLSRWLRWYRLRRAAVWALRGLAAGLALGLAFSLAALASRSILQREAVWAAAACTAAGLLVGAAAAFLWPVRRLAAARYFDRRFGLRERVSTALELAQTEPADPLPALGEEIRSRQLDDALAAARAVDPRRSLPLQLPGREILLVLTLIAALILSWRSGAPAFQAAERARSLEAAVQAEAARLEQIVSRVEAAESLTQEQKEALTAPLQRAAQELQLAETPEQAVSILTRAEGELSELAANEDRPLARALQEAGENLSQEGSGPLSPAVESLAGGQTGAAALSLAELDPAGLSPGEQERLAGQLEAAARTLAESDPDLAGQLREAAARIRDGDLQAAREALQEAAQSLAEAAGQQAQGEMAEEALDQLAQSRGRLAQGSEASAQAQGTGGQGPGTGSSGDGQGRGEGQGQGSGQGQSQGSAGAGAGRGEGSGSGEAGAEAGPGPIGQANGPGDGGERPYEAIGPPERLGGASGELIALPAGDQPGEEVVGQGDVPLEQTGRSRVPYTEVYQTYAEAYSRAVESGQVPAPFRDLVRDYFSSLEP